MFKTRKINILGTEWTINVVNGEKSKYLKYGRLDGLCQYDNRIILVDNMTRIDITAEARVNIIKHSLRHEIVHAFLAESGLNYSAIYEGHWAENEEMIDWFAWQSPKIFEVYKELDIL